MNTKSILTVLKADGFDARSRWASDDSDMRFVDFLESKARKTLVELDGDIEL